MKQQISSTAPRLAGIGALAFMMSVVTSLSGQELLLAPIADSYVFESEPNSNFGSYKELATKNTTVHWRESYLRFDVSEVLALGGVIESASLELFCWNTDPNGKSQTAAITFLSGAWEEMTVTYNNRPVLGNIVDIVAVEDGRVNTNNKKYHYWNALPLVQHAIDNRQQNNQAILNIGLLSDTSSQGHKIVFHSRNNSIHRPILRLTMASNPDNSSPVINHIAAEPSLVMGTSCQLSVSASDADEADHLRYAWRVVQQPDNSQPEFHADLAATQVAFNRVGHYQFEVTVNDGKGGNAAQTVTVEVAASPSGLQIAP